MTDEARERFTIHKLHRIKEIPAAFSQVMDCCDVRMVDAGCGPGFPQKTAPGALVTDELRTNDLQGHRGPEVGIDRLIGYSHAAMPELQRLSVLISENLVMLKTEFGRGVRNRIALGF